MKWHIVFSLLFILALVAPLVWTAPVESVEAIELAEEVQESDSGSVELIKPRDYIDVKDHTRPPHPWWCFGIEISNLD
ncbi:hypothetical protein ACLKA7_006996 [Drosophila subpalustris]